MPKGTKSKKPGAAGSGNILNYFTRPATKPPSTPERRPTLSERPVSDSPSSPLSFLSKTPSIADVADLRPLSYSPAPPPAVTPSPEDGIAEPTSQSGPVFSFLNSTPVQSEPRLPVSREAVIAASDDDDSDGSLEPLEVLLASRPNPSTPSANRRGPNHFATPNKRRKEDLFSSPLTIQPRVHRFDMADLLRDAKKENTFQASIQRINEMQDRAENERQESKLSGDSLRKTLMSTVGDEQDHSLDKVVRAVERTVGVSAQPAWYIFRPTTGTKRPNPHPFPKALVVGLCGMQASNKAAKDLNLDVLSVSVRLSRKPLPEELFLWLLSEICVEESDIRRGQMCEVMRLFPCEDAANVVTPKCLEGLFMRLGASQDIATLAPTEPEVSRTPEDGYYKRDWRCLSAVLNALAEVAESLTHEAAVYGIQILLAMAVDAELLHDPAVLTPHRRLLSQLISALRIPEWGTACEQAISFIYNTFPCAEMRLRPVKFLSVTAKRAYDLRRRMAAVFFFEDPSLAKQSPELSVNVQGIRTYLESGRFKITPDTDYAELRAMMLLLDVALDMGSRFDAEDPLQSDNLNKSFDAEVDSLASALKELSRSVNDTGMKSTLPMEAKMVMDWVGERLSYTIRTKLKPKISIYDLPGQPPAQASLPQQQNYMKMFLQGKSKRPMSSEKTTN